MTILTVNPRGWTAWSVPLAAGDTVRVRATCTSGYGWVAVLDKAYAYLTKQQHYDARWPGVVSFTATKAGTYRVGTGRVGTVTVQIDVEPAVTVSPSWTSPGPFGPSSFWRTRVDGADQQLHEDSPALVADLAQQVADFYGGIAALNVTQYNLSCYEVSASTPRVDVAFRDEQRKGYTPWQVRDHFAAVPMTAEMIPATGTDAALAVWCPQTDQLWEWWRAKLDPLTGHWSAVWGGRIDDVSTSPGFFRDGMGASATGVATSRGCVGIAEARAGRIDHALSLAIPRQARYSSFSWPAQRSDGNGRSPIPEGLTLRLDPAVDVAALKLTPIARMIARAAQEYGFVVTDNAGCVALAVENGAPVRRATGVDPWSAILAGVPAWAALRNFPWHRMQALPHDHGRYLDRVSADVEGVVGDSR